MKKYFIVFTVVDSIQQKIVNVSGIFFIDIDKISKDLHPKRNDLFFDRCDKTLIEKCGLDPNKTSISNIIPL